MRLAVIGTGYVGLVTAGCLANEGFHLSCIDREQDKIHALNEGTLPFYEPGLQGIISSALERSKIEFTTCYEDAICDAAVIFIAVGTPLDEYGKLDLSQIFDVFERLVPFLNTHKVLVIKSTVPVGTAHKLTDYILKLNPQAKFDIILNPEFLRAGSAVHDFMHPDRMVLGSTNGSGLDTIKRVYERWIHGGTPCIETTYESAEIIKQAANAFLATKLSFINEISDLCELSGANIHEVTQGLSYDPRIGHHYLSPGPGFGGSCLNKDASSLVSSGESYGFDLSVVKAAAASNQKRKKSLADRVLAYCGGSVQGMRITLLGLTFKEETDDMRESPSLDLIPALIAAGASIVAHDPLGSINAQRLLPNIDFRDDIYQALASADVAVLMTSHHQFKNLDLRKVKQLMKGDTFIDLRNALDGEDISVVGFHYYSLGFRYPSSIKKKSLAEPSQVTVPIVQAAIP